MNANNPPGRQVATEAPTGITGFDEMTDQKYRGSGFDENESPFVIGDSTSRCRLRKLRQADVARPEAT